MIKLFTPYLFFSLLLTSCTAISKKFDALTLYQSDKKNQEKRLNRNLYCKENTSFELIIEDSKEDEEIDLYHHFLFQKSLSYHDKIILLILSEFMRRPDVFKSSATFTIISRFNNNEYFSTFTPNSINSSPALKAILSYIKKNSLHNNFSYYLKLADQYIPTSVPVSLELQNFIENNKKNILKNEITSQLFLKADQPITKYETFTREKYQNSLKEYSPNTDDSIETPLNLSLVKENSSGNIKCNFNNLKNDDIPNSHYVGIKDKNNFFIAISTESESSSQVINPKLLTYFKNKPYLSELPICQLTGNSNNSILISTSGRKPDQHLKHLISYGIQEAESTNHLQVYLNFSRHIFLNSPDRILYESKKGRKSQLDFFLSMNFPIYHVDSLGDIVGISEFQSQNKKDTKLFIDERNHRKIWCKNDENP